MLRRTRRQLPQSTSAIVPGTSDVASAFISTNEELRSVSLRKEGRNEQSSHTRGTSRRCAAEGGDRRNCARHRKDSWMF